MTFGMIPGYYGWRALSQRFDKEKSRTWRRIWTCKIHERLKIVRNTGRFIIVFLNEKIYISALYRRHKCAVQVKCSTSKESSWA